jgi:DNA-3-methyladenine glycosylase I
MSQTTKYPDGRTRCYWPKNDPTYIEYHDEEWGVPLSGDQEMFERIALEGFQAGLSWITILRRREGFRRAFENFDIARVAAFGDKQIDELMQDVGIIRNRAKIVATIHNARLVGELQLAGRSISDEVWQFAPTNRKRTDDAQPFEWIATSPESDALSRHLRALGFKFVGSTTMFALMQAVGMYNDHAPGCYRRSEIG